VEVTDTEKAKYALRVVGFVFLAELALLLLQWGLITVGLFGQAVFVAQSLLWVLVTGATAFGAFLLSRAVKQGELLTELLGLCGLMVCLSLFWLFVNVMRLDDGPSGFEVPVAVSALGVAVGFVIDVVFLIVIGKLGRTTAFAAGVGAFAAVRVLITLGFMFNPTTELHRMSWMYPVRMLLSLIATGGLGALALHARGALVGSTPSAASAPIVEPEPGGTRLVVTGLVLLGLGIGGTALSYSTASSGSGGGRYVIATGAIATGLVQLVRGLGKLTATKR
jgi:hypothetical protein